MESLLLCNSFGDLSWCPGCEYRITLEKIKKSSTGSPSQPTMKKQGVTCLILWNQYLFLNAADCTCQMCPQLKVALLCQ